MISVGDLLAYLKLRDELSPAVQEAGRNLDKFNEQSSTTAYQLTVLGRGLREAGALATGMFTVPIVAAAEETIKFGGEFETQMTRVTTLAGASTKEVASLRQSVLDLGPATGIGPSKLAEGLFVLESFGQRGAVAMDTLRVSAEMSALGMGATSENARALTGAIFAYRNQNLSAAEAGDILTKTVQLGNMKISELTPALARVNPIAAAMGVSFQDVAASIATFTHAGVDSAMAATGIRAVLNSILTDSAKTEKGFAALAKATGDNTITMANFRKEMTEHGLTAAMIQLTDNVNKAGDAGVTAMGQIIPNIRGLTEALAVYKTNGGMVVDILGQLRDSHGTLAKSTEELHKTWQFQWAQMTSEIEKMWISLGDAGLMDIFKQLLSFIRGDLFPILRTLTTWFSEQPDWVKKAEFAVAGFLAVLGPGLIVLGQFAMAIGNISRGFALLQEGGAVASGASSIIAFLSNPWVLGGALVIGGIALAIHEYNKNMEMVKSVEPTTVTFLSGLKDSNGNLAVTAEQAKKAAEGLGELTNGFSTSIPSMVAHAAATSVTSDATQTLLQKVQALTQEERNSIDADKAKGMTITQIAKATNIAADVIGIYERQTGKANKATTEWQKILDNIDSAGVSFHDTLMMMDGGVVSWAEHLLKAGVDTETVRKYYGLTETQIKALKHETDEYTKTMKELDMVEQGATKSSAQALAILSQMGQHLNPNDFNAIAQKVHEIEEGFFGIGKGLTTIGEKIKPTMADLKYLPVGFLESFSTAIGKLPDLLVKSFSGGGGVTGALSGLGSMVAGSIGSSLFGSLNKDGMVVGGMFSGLTGSFAKMIPAIGPAIGAAVGPLIQFIATLFDHTGSDVMRDVGTGWGVKLSKGMQDAIVKDVKSGMSEMAAELKNLSGIITDAGGLNPNNIGMFTSKLHDIFSMIQTGQMTVAQGSKVIADNWSTFVEAATSGDGRISDSLKEIIRLNEIYGTNVKAIADWQKTQGAAALDGFVAVAGSLADLIPGYDELKKAIDSAAPKSKELALALKDQAKEAEHSKGALADIGIQAIASFAAAVASGMSMSEAMAKIHPALANLKKAYSDLGITTDDVALRNLMLQDTIISGNPNLISAVQGLGAEMVALDNLGLLNVDTFAAMERTGMEMYARLLNAAIDATGGYDEMTGAVKDIDGATRLALGQMQIYLHKAQDEAEKLGIPLDDNTQRLIEQSKKAGIWQTAITPSDKLLGAMQTLVDKVTDLVNTLNNIPKNVTTTVTTVHRDVNEDNSPSERQGFAFGTYGSTGSFFKDFGGGTNVRLHGNEAVVRADQAGSFAAAVGGGNDELIDAFESLEATIEDQTREFKLAIREAVATR